MKSGRPSLPVLPKLLRALLRTDADFDAFVLDYFADVHGRFARGMDCVSKVNLLLELTAPPDVLTQLSQRYRSDRNSLDLIARYLNECETEHAQQAWVLREELERLYVASEERRLRRQDIAPTAQESPDRESLWTTESPTTLLEALRSACWAQGCRSASGDISERAPP